MQIKLIWPMQLIWAFVFTYAKSRFSHDMAHIIDLLVVHFFRQSFKLVIQFLTRHHLTFLQDICV